MVFILFHQTSCLLTFQGSGNDPFSHITAMFVNMPFSKEDHILIQDLCQLKVYTAHKGE